MLIPNQNLFKRINSIQASLLVVLSSFVQISNQAVAATGTLNLKQAVTEAMADSPKVQKAKSYYEESSWKKTEAMASYLPTVAITGTDVTSQNYLLTDVNLGGSAISVPSIIPTYLLGVTGSWNIFDGWASTNRYQAASAQEQSGQAEYDWTRFQTEREIALQFYKALAAQQLLEVANSNLRALEDHRKDVEIFNKAGVSTRFDLLRVDVQVSEAQSELLNATDNVDTSKRKLAELIGHESEERELVGQLPVLSPSAIQGLNQDYSQRPDLIALTKRAEASEYMASSASKHWVPKVNLYGNYSYYNNRNSDISDSKAFRDAYQVGVTFTWNIFDGFASYAKSKQSIEQKTQAEKSLRAAQLKAKQDQEFWKRKFNYFCLVYKSRTNDVEKATESVRLAKEGRRVGARTNTDLLDAENELFKARAGVVNAQIGAIEALISLELATGQNLFSNLKE